MSVERRHDKRLLFCKEVEVVGYGSRRSSDLSAGGIFLETIASFPRDTQLKLRFKLREEDPHPIEVRGRVLYEASGIGVGVEFLDLRAGDRERIERELELQSLSETS